ncbi:MAG: hypothetical protein AAFY47_04590 [Pseudomonadota bacterium]
MIHKDITKPMGFRVLDEKEVDAVSGGHINGQGNPWLNDPNGTVLDIDFDLGIGSDFPPSTTDPFGVGNGGDGIPGDFLGSIAGTQFGNPSDLVELQNMISQVIDPLSELVDEITLNEGTQAERTLNGVGGTLPSGQTVFIYADSNSLVIQSAIELN